MGMRSMTKGSPLVTGRTGFVQPAGADSVRDFHDGRVGDRVDEESKISKILGRPRCPVRSIWRQLCPFQPGRPARPGGNDGTKAPKVPSSLRSPPVGVGQASNRPDSRKPALGLTSDFHLHSICPNLIDLRQLRRVRHAVSLGRHQRQHMSFSTLHHRVSTCFACAGTLFLLFSIPTCELVVRDRRLTVAQLAAPALRASQCDSMVRRMRFPYITCKFVR